MANWMEEMARQLAAYEQVSNNPDNLKGYITEQERQKFSADMMARVEDLIKRHNSGEIGGYELGTILLDEIPVDLWGIVEQRTGGGTVDSKRQRFPGIDLTN